MTDRAKSLSLKTESSSSDASAAIETRSGRRGSLSRLLGTLRRSSSSAEKLDVAPAKNSPLSVRSRENSITKLDQMGSGGSSSRGSGVLLSPRRSSAAEADYKREMKLKYEEEQARSGRVLARFAGQNGGITLEDVLSVPEAKELFRNHCKARYCDENLRFYECSRPLADGNFDRDNLKAQCEQIFSQYLSEEAEEPVNVSSKAVAAARGKLFNSDSGDYEHCFDECLNDVFHNMHMDTFPPFLRNNRKQLQTCAPFTDYLAGGPASSSSSSKIVSKVNVADATDAAQQQTPVKTAAGLASPSSPSKKTIALGQLVRVKYPDGTHKLVHADKSMTYGALLELACSKRQLQFRKFVLRPSADAASNEADNNDDGSTAATSLRSSRRIFATSAGEDSETADSSIVGSNVNDGPRELFLADRSPADRLADQNEEKQAGAVRPGVFASILPSFDRNDGTTTTSSSSSNNNSKAAAYILSAEGVASLADAALADGAAGLVFPPCSMVPCPLTKTERSTVMQALSTAVEKVRSDKNSGRWPSLVMRCEGLKPRATMLADLQLADVKAETVVDALLIQLPSDLPRLGESSDEEFAGQLASFLDQVTRIRNDKPCKVVLEDSLLYLSPRRLKLCLQKGASLDAVLLAPYIGWDADLAIPQLTLSRRCIAMKEALASVIIAGQTRTEIFSGPGALANCVTALDAGCTGLFVPAAAAAPFCRLRRRHAGGLRKPALVCLRKLLPCVAFASSHPALSEAFYGLLGARRGLCPPHVLSSTVEDGSGSTAQFTPSEPIAEGEVATPSAAAATATSGVDLTTTSKPRSRAGSMPELPISDRKIAWVFDRSERRRAEELAATFLSDQLNTLNEL